MNDVLGTCPFACTICNYKGEFVLRKSSCSRNLLQAKDDEISYPDLSVTQSPEISKVPAYFFAVEATMVLCQVEMLSRSRVAADRILPLAEIHILPTTKANFGSWR